MAQIDVTKILPNPQQPRVEFDPDELAALAQSIKANGLINPISVEAQYDGFYIIIDGERRWRACKLAGIDLIEASIRPPMNGTGSKNRLVMALAANIQRKNMNPVEEGLAVKKMVEVYGMSLDEVGAALGLTQSPIRYRLQLVELPAEVQQLFAEKRLGFDAGIINALRKISDREDMTVLAKNLARTRANLATVEKVVTRYLSGINGGRVAAARQHKKAGRKSVLDGLPVDGILDWDEIKRGASKICDDCVLLDMAEKTGCRDCPMLDMLKLLAGGNDEKK